MKQKHELTHTHTDSLKRALGVLLIRILQVSPQFARLSLPLCSSFYARSPSSNCRQKQQGKKLNHAMVFSTTSYGVRLPPVALTEKRGHIPMPRLVPICFELDLIFISHWVCVCVCLGQSEVGSVYARPGPDSLFPVV